MCPFVEVGLALAEGALVGVVVGDVVDEAHVGVEGVHGGAFGLGEELEAIVKIAGLAPGDAAAEVAGLPGGGWGRWRSGCG